MANLANANAKPYRAADKELVKQFCYVDVGATGAATVDSSASSSDFTCTRTGAGTYNLAFKACVDATHPQVSLKSAALTVVGVVCTAFNPGAGTATIKTLAGVNAATATDPANGDAFSVVIEGQPFGS